MLKDKILEYMKLNPNTLYYDLVKIFGLPLDKLFKILGITNYQVDDYFTQIFDNNGNLIYRESLYGNWVKQEYNDDDNCIYQENSDGLWSKWEFDNNGDLYYFKDSNGKSHKF